MLKRQQKNNGVLAVNSRSLDSNDRVECHLSRVQSPRWPYVCLFALLSRRLDPLHRDREFSLSAQRNWSIVGHKKKLGYAYAKKEIYVGDIVRVADRRVLRSVLRMDREFTRLMSVKVVISLIPAFAPLVSGFSHYLGLQRGRNWMFLLSRFYPLLTDWLSSCSTKTRFYVSCSPMWQICFSSTFI